ncbi:hypothetical protein KAU15_06640 [candidate division WOR-3 bacterium]|nr:hypothetical protein [candidate division WOR-3 bacterium]
MIKLNIDPRWGSDQKDIEEKFKSISKVINFRKEVSEKVVDRFRMVKRLIEFSAYEYELLDPSFERCLSTIELALRIRYKEIEGKAIQERKDSLFHYIEWGNKVNLFDNYGKEVHILRKLRDSFVGHVKGNTIAGGQLIPIILDIVIFINALYDNPIIRKERKDLTRGINKKLKKIIKKGGIIEIDSERYIIFEGKLIIYENRGNNKYYHLYLFPIFNLENKSKDIKIPGSFIIRCKNITGNKEEIILHLNDNKLIKITNIKKSENIKKYAEFIYLFEKNKIGKPIQYSMGMYNTMEKIKDDHRNYLIEEVYKLRK